MLKMIFKKIIFEQKMPPKKYVKMNEIDHILERSDMYVGSIVPELYEFYTVLENNSQIQIGKRKILISEAFFTYLYRTVIKCNRQRCKK